jgi:hypothetical protein
MNELALAGMQKAVLRNGTELPLTAEQGTRLQSLLCDVMTSHKFIGVGKNTINTADIVGVFQADELEEFSRKKNGQWMCKWETWHDKGEECGCGIMARYKTFKASDIN